MNPSLQKLQPYPFEKLTKLKEGTQPPTDLDHIALSIGEPKHPTPEFIADTVISHLHGLSNYPTTKGSVALRESFCDWLSMRFNINTDLLNPDQHVLPVNGTREALFSFAQAIIDPTKDPLVIMPNPFYQIYEGAALLANAEPLFMACNEHTNFLVDFSTVTEQQWQRCQLVFVCSPGNPTGAIVDTQTYQELITLANKYDFIIAADECYSELYFDESKPPTGLLQACIETGNTNFHRCVVFHSLSKRSNAPGLRSGFVAGDAHIIQQYFSYRTYHGCAMPLQHQAASIAAWRDEKHVENNRALYRQKFDAVIALLSPFIEINKPDAGFYLWIHTPISDTEFARGLYDTQNVTVLPGSFLSRDIEGVNPGQNKIRLALVAPLDECIDAAKRIINYIKQL